MVVVLVYMHDCGSTCPYISQMVLVTEEVINGTAYRRPVLYCYYTQMQLKLMTVNGMPV